MGLFLLLVEDRCVLTQVEDLLLSFIQELPQSSDLLLHDLHLIILLLLGCPDSLQGHAGFLPGDLDFKFLLVFVVFKVGHLVLEDLLEAFKPGFGPVLC